MEANKKKRRVGMLVHSFFTADPRVRREAESLAEDGFDVHVLCCRFPSSDHPGKEPSHEVVKGVHVHRLPLCKKRGNKFRYLFEFALLTVLGAWKLLALHFRKRFDVIHINNMPDILVLAGLIPKWTGATLVLDVHDPMSELFQANYHVNEYHPLVRSLRVQESISYKMADRLMTVSVPMAENVAKKSGRSEESIKVVHNFPDFGSFPVREDRGAWPYNKDGLVFLYSGTVTEHYRLDVAIRAFAKLASDIPNFKFRILGGGNRIEDILLLAERLGIGGKVERLKFVPSDTVRNVMADADFGISTHQSGTFGNLYFSNKILEFMTQGIPVICSRTYTLEKYIPESAIFYFEPENVDDMVRTIHDMLKHPEVVLEKTRTAKKVIEKYNWKTEKKAFVDYYSELCHSSAGCPANIRQPQA